MKKLRPRRAFVWEIFLKFKRSLPVKYIYIFIFLYIRICFYIYVYIFYHYSLAEKDVRSIHQNDSGKLINLLKY